MKLNPPLTVIEEHLSAPPLEMIPRWFEEDSRLSSADRDKLMEDPGFGAALSDWERIRSTVAEPLADVPPLPMPAHLAAKIRQRLASRAAAVPLQPAPGIIVRIVQAIGPDGSLDRAMTQPLSVLLSEPSGRQQAVWHGWLMAWETDYATHEDLLLEEESDGPYDPSAAMVQTWNPVCVHWPAASAVLGRLAPERLAAVRALERDLGRLPPVPETVRPGALVQRTTSEGHLILTGTPLGGSADPRWMYRKLYGAAAAPLREMAPQAPDGEPVPPWWKRVLGAFQETARAADLALAPAPMAALGAPEPEIGQVWRLADWIDWSLIPSTHGDSMRLHLKLLRSTPLLVGLTRNDRVRQQAWLTPDAPETDLVAAADQGLSFFIRGETGATLFELRLQDNDVRR